MDDGLLELLALGPVNRSSYMSNDWAVTSKSPGEVDFHVPDIPLPKRQKLRSWLDIGSFMLTWDWRNGYRCFCDRELMRARQLNEREAFGGAELAAVHYDLFEFAAAKHCDLCTLTQCRCCF